MATGHVSAYALFIRYSFMFMQIKLIFIRFCTKPRFETEAARIFQRRMGGGGVTLCHGEGIHPIVMSISPSVVGRLRKKGSQSGLSRAP